MAGLVINAGIGGTVGSALVYGTYWGVTAGLTIGATVGLETLTRPKVPGVEATQTPFKQQRPAKRWCTGRMRVAGKALLWDHVPDWNIDVWAINEGRIDGFEQFYIHDDAVTVNPATGAVQEFGPSKKYWGSESVYIFGRPGRTTEIPTPKLVGLAGSKWTNNHRADGVACIDVMAQNAGDKYNPRVYQDPEIAVTALARMSRVYDWRDNTQSLTDPSTWKWSENAVVTHLCWEWFGRYIAKAREDYVTPNAEQLREWNKRFAPALSYWTTAANIADENVPLKSGGTEKRYRAAVAYEFGTDPAETRKLYLNSYDGRMFRLKNGAWAVRAGKYVEPTLTLGDTDILEVVEWSRGRTETEFCNSLTSTFLDAGNKYTEQPVDPWEDLASIEQVGSVGKDFPLPSVPSHGQARRLLKREMSRRRASHIGTLMVKKDVAQAIADGAHRWIRVQISNGPLSLSDAVLEIAGNVVIDHMAQRATVPVMMADGFLDLWDAALEEGFGPNETTRTAPPAITTPVIASIVAEVQGVSGALLAVRIPSPNNHLFEYAVSWRKVGGDWNDGDFKDYADATIEGVNYAVVRSTMVQAGADYEVRVRARKSMFLSDWSSVTAVDFDGVPAPTPGDWTLQAVAGQNGLTGVYLQVTGACAYPFAAEILVAYRLAGIGDFISWGPYPPDTTIIPIGPVDQSGFYEVAIAYRAKWGAVGDALVIYSGSSSVQPVVVTDIADGDYVPFVPALPGIPTYSVDMSGCLSPGPGEVQLYRVTELTTDGARIALKLSDETETTDHVTSAGAGIGAHYEAVKPTAADAYNGKYKFTVTIDRNQPAPGAPIMSFSPLYVLPAGATDWVRVGEVGGIGNTPTPQSGFGTDVHVVTLDIPLSLGSTGATQFRAYNTSSTGYVRGLTVEYDTEVTSAGEVPATDATHKGKVTFYPPGYGGTVTDGIFFDNPAVAALPVLAPPSVPAAELLAYSDGQRVKIPVTQLPFGTGGGSDPYAASNIDSQGNTEAAFNTALANAKSMGIPLTGDKGSVTITSQKVITGCSVLLGFKAIKFGANLGDALAVVNYTGGSTGAPVTIPVRGPAIELGGSPAANVNYEKTLRVIGGYTEGGAGQSTAFTAMRIQGDQSARASYDLGLQYHRGDGLEINSDTEKKIITYRFDHLFEGYALTFRATGGASPDEVNVRLTGTFCSNLVYAQEGGQFSYRIEFAVESVKPWVGSYAIEDGSRKGTCYAGEIRGIDGDLLKVETRQSGYSSAGPTVVFDNLRIIQHYCGRISVINPKSVGGTIFHDQVDNTREAVKTTAYRNSMTSGQDMHLTRAAFQPAFQIGNVLENCALTYVTRRNVCPVGARIGINDWVNPIAGTPSDPTVTEAGSPFNGKSIRLEIEMGDRNGPGDVVGSFSGTTLSVPKPDGAARPSITAGQFLRGPGLPYWLRVVTAPSTSALNALADDVPATYTVNQAVTTGAITIDTRATPDMFYAAWADYGDSSTIWANGNLQGNILISAGWQRGTIHVSAAWVRAGYTVDIDPAATTDFIIHGPMSLAELATIAWAFKGVKVLTVTDFDGAGAYFNGSVWVPLSPPLIPELSMSAMGSPYNDSFIKRTGLSVVRNDNALPYYATGSARAAVWQTPGGASITPGYDVATTSFETRSGGFSTAYKLAFDRFIYDLRLAGVFTGNSATSKLKGFWPLMGPSDGAARNNLLFDFWDLDVSDMEPHAPGIGYVPYPSGGGTFPLLEPVDWVDDAKKYGTSGHNLMILASCGVLLNSAQSQDEAGGPYFTAGGNSDPFRVCFHRSDGGNHAQINATLASKVIAPSLADSGMSHRIGMAWTPGTTSQSIRMFGGQTATAAKVASPGGPSTRIFFGHAHDYYLRIPIELAGLGSGDFTSDEAGATLAAVNTLRSALLALA